MATLQDLQQHIAMYIVVKLLVSLTIAKKGTTVPREVLQLPKQNVATLDIIVPQALLPLQM